MSQETDIHDRLPDAIVERLRARDRALSMLTPDVDRAVAEMARAQFASQNADAPRQQPQRQSSQPPGLPGARPRQGAPRLAVAVRRRRLSYAAAAAVALVAFFIVRPFDQNGLAPVPLANDIDGSGRVDILDAFALARTRASDPGSVSDERIDELLRQVVSLGATERVL